MDKYDKENTRQVLEKLKILLPDKDVFEQVIFQQIYSAEITYDFKRKDLKRLNVKETTFKKTTQISLRTSIKVSLH